MALAGLTHGHRCGGMQTMPLMASCCKVLPSPTISQAHTASSMQLHLLVTGLKISVSSRTTRTTPPMLCTRGRVGRPPLQQVRSRGSYHHPDRKELLRAHEPQDRIPPQQCRRFPRRLFVRPLVAAIHDRRPIHPHLQLPVWLLTPHCRLRVYHIPLSG